jgi:hypothetical protein
MSDTAADRQLHGCAGNHDQAHHQRDFGGGDADARAVDGAQRPPGAVGDADQQTRAKETGELA